MNCGKKKAMQTLKTAKGQIEGIIRMLEDDRYCLDITNQILAVQALLKKTNSTILKQHLDHCVKESKENGDFEDKIDEITVIIDKVINSK